MLPILRITPYTSLIGFLVGLPTLIATYYQAWKARHESREARKGLIFSGNCLEFVRNDGTSVNLVPLETLHSLPHPGDIVLLPGDGQGRLNTLHPGAYRVSRVEHIYARVVMRRAMPGQARLAKTVAHVDTLTEWEQRPADEASTSTLSEAM